MTWQAALEQRYRRLLAWYPRGFHAEHRDEMLAVLMAGAADGQQRPGLPESADVLRSALGMRLRSVRARLGGPQWADALAVFTLVAPLFALAVAAGEVLLPYRRTPGHQFPWLGGTGFGGIQLGGTHLLHLPMVGFAVGGQVAVAALVLLGLRRVALAAVLASIAGCLGYLAAASGPVFLGPHPLQLITAGVYLLEAAALAASPGPRHGRRLVHWGHGAVLLLAVAAVQASTFVYGATLPLFGGGDRAPGAYLAASAVLTAAVLILALVLRLGWRFVLLLAVACYPLVTELLCRSIIGHTELLGHPVPGTLVLLFLPPVLFACAVLITPAVSTGGAAPHGPEQPPVPA